MLDWLQNLFGRNVLNYTAVDERTGRRGKFKFRISRRGGEYRAYIIDRPALDGRDGNAHKVHVLTDNGKPYVCVVNSIESRKKMVAVAKLWARKYLRYVETGMLFEE